MERFRWLPLALLMVLIQPAFANDGERAWELVSDRNDIQVYMRHRDNSRLKTFRGVTEFKLADEYALVAVLNDYPSYPKWLHFVDGASEFNRDGPLQRWLRFTTHLPWPLADREAVLEAQVSQTLTEEEQSVKVDLINQPDQLPPNDDYIRFPELVGKLYMQRVGNQNIRLTYELILDPGGYIPAWLVNILMRDAPYFTLERLRRVVHKPEYRNQYFDYLDLRGPGRPDNTALAD